MNERPVAEGAGRDDRPRVGGACANCGAALAGPYCHVCGQEASGPPESLVAFLTEALSDLFNFRSRTLRSLRTLALRPGKLTHAYFSGKRVRYTAPLKVYLLSAAVFFLVNEYRPFVRVTGDDRVVSSLSGAADVIEGLGSELDELEAQGLSRELVWERFRWTVSRSLPQFMIGSVVLFALALALFSPRRAALRHAVFSLHWTGFFLLFMSLERLVPRTGGGPDFVALFFSVALLVHLSLALRRAYGHSWPRAIASGVGLFFVFNVILAAWMMAVITYAIRTVA